MVDDLIVSALAVLAVFAIAVAAPTSGFVQVMSGDGSEALWGIGAVALLCIFTALCLSLFGTTPGKALYRIDVAPMTWTGQSGDFAGRELRVFFAGLGIGFPIAALCTMFWQHARLRRAQPASYDEGRFLVAQHSIRGAGSGSARSWSSSAASPSLRSASGARKSTHGPRLPDLRQHDDRQIHPDAGWLANLGTGGHRGGASLGPVRSGRQHCGLRLRGAPRQPCQLQRLCRCRGLRLRALRRQRSQGQFRALPAQSRSCSDRWACIAPGGRIPSGAPAELFISPRSARRLAHRHLTRPARRNRRSSRRTA